MPGVLEVVYGSRQDKVSVDPQGEKWSGGERGGLDKVEQWQCSQLGRLAAVCLTSARNAPS